MWNVKKDGVPMKFGLCAPLSGLRDIASAGFDYLEPPVNGVAAMTEEEFAAALAEVKAVGLPCPAFNLLFPRTMALLEPATTNDAIAGYLHGAMKRVQALGGQIAVFGSGKSRNRPENMSYGDAFRRLTEIARLAGEIAGQYGVTIVMEPLNRAESNIINSMAEGAALVAAVNHPSVALLTDYYHVANDGEPVSDIARLGNIRHVHIATKEGRRYPMSAEQDDFAGFFGSLKAIGYEGRVSIEGKCDDMAADAPVALAMLKRLWEEA